MKKTPIVRKTGLRRGGPIKRAGKKTLKWEAMRKRLKVAFQRAGITVCEGRYHGCWHDNGLGFAHTLKRRLITTEEQLAEVALMCNCCHDAVEAMPPATMAGMIRSIIRNRKVEVKL